MKKWQIFFPFLALCAITSCSQKQEEAEEPDYDNMVMADEEEGWVTDEERDRKMIADEPPDPQELIIFELPEEGIR